MDFRYVVPLRHWLSARGFFIGYRSCYLILRVSKAFGYSCPTETAYNSVTFYNLATVDCTLIRSNEKWRLSTAATLICWRSMVWSAWSLISYINRNLLINYWTIIFKEYPKEIYIPFVVFEWSCYPVSTVSTCSSSFSRGGVGVLDLRLNAGRLRPEVPPLHTPFVYLPLTHGSPFTYLV